MSTIPHIKSILRHIRNVQDNCILLGEKLIENGEVNLGVSLIAKSMLHDNSKFYGIEYDYLHQEGVSEKDIRLAATNHNRTNDHHPEYWGKIQNMPDICLAELSCDWKTRSGEFGTDLREWINSCAMTRFGFTKEDEVYKKIMKYVDMICDKPFKQL